MHEQIRLSRSQRKHIRQEKARIRARFWDRKEQERLIKELYRKFAKKPKIKPQEQSSPKPQNPKTKKQGKTKH